ncbi:hypothetical protein Clacol_004391 [Clathrus columnatus]|uniref:Uncharacterized protein n=1 Tax=Clathrus columnatus TaxID=1419009 RepID=A0AAV5AE07_9AGAM|nr:hypothetical protein Clacol_004391 [Clathrus columnatus]
MISEELAQSVSQGTIQVEIYIAASVSPVFLSHFTPNPKEMTMLQTSLCDDLGFVGSAMAILSLIGIQGLISVRTFALYRGYRPMTIALSASFLAALISNIYAFQHILALVSNVAVIFTDVLAFLAVIRQIWGLWREKRRLGLHSDEDVVTLLLQQVTQVIIEFIPPISVVGIDFSAFQNAYEPPYYICTYEWSMYLRLLTSQAISDTYLRIHFGTPSTEHKITF